jgi:hypothetical protein
MLVQVPEEVEGFHADIGAFQLALEQALKDSPDLDRKLLFVVDALALPLERGTGVAFQVVNPAPE